MMTFNRLGRSRCALLALSALLVSGAAQADSGFFPGAYVREGAFEKPLAGEAIELKCALAPVVVDEDGIGSGYYLDRELFQTSGTISYIKGQEFDCRYNPETKLETCASQELSDGKTLHYYRTNVYRVFTWQLQRGNSLLTPEEVLLWNSSKTFNPANGFAYHRCHCITETLVAAHASREMNQLSGDETGRRLYWGDETPGDADRVLAREVLDKLGVCNGTNSS